MAKQIEVKEEGQPLLVGISFGTVYSSVSIVSKVINSSGIGLGCSNGGI